MPMQVFTTRDNVAYTVFVHSIENETKMKLKSLEVVDRVKNNYKINI